MAQGRIISPDFWTDYRMTQLSFAARLFYIGTWNHAYCDQGHLPDDSAELKMKILPADAVDPDALIAELLGAGRIERRKTPGDKSYLVIPRFGDHQRKDDPRWARKCPICREVGNPQQTTQEHARGLRREEGSGVERNRGGVQQTPPPRYCPKHPEGTNTGCYACRDARIAHEAWTKRAPAYVRPKPGDGHNHQPDQHGYCPTCGERA